MRTILCDATLWAAIFSLAIIIGGSIYQSMVVFPAWTRNLPDSLIAFNKTDVKPSVFWASPLTSVLPMLSMIAATASNWGTPRQYWVLVSFLLYLLGMVATVIYFIPKLKVIGIIDGKVADDPVVLTQTTRNWILADKFRFYLLVLPAFFLLMKALGIPAGI